MTAGVAVSYYCGRGHWTTSLTGRWAGARLRCTRCERLVAEGMLPWLPADRIWEEEELLADSELLADLRSVREALKTFSTLERLRVGLRMQGIRSPFPGGRE